MITSAQLKASRALLGLDQRELADLCGVSLPTIQRMESSGGTVRGMIDTLVKIVTALDAAGIELLGEHAPSSGVGRGVRMKDVQSPALSAATDKAAQSVSKPNAPEVVHSPS